MHGFDGQQLSLARQQLEVGKKDLQRECAQEAIIRAINSQAVSIIQTINDFGKRMLHHLFKLLDGQYNNFRRNAIRITFKVKVRYKALIEKVKKGSQRLLLQ